MTRAGKLLWAVSITLLVGCISKEDICRSGVDQVCERVFQCQTTEAQAQQTFIDAFGTSVENCKALLYANPLRPKGATGVACAEVKSEGDLCVNAGDSTHSQFILEKAEQCRTERAQLSCDDYLAQLSDTSLAPTSCGDRCH